MKTSTIIALVAALGVGVLAYKLLWTAAAPKLAHALGQVELTDNEKAANGPLPGDVSLYESELSASGALTSPGYYPSLNAAEIADAVRNTGAFAFPAASKDAAIIVTLNPGSYTAQVTGADGISTGVALVEIYEIPQ